MNFDIYVKKLQSGEAVQFRPKGNSMKPRINSGELITVIPITPDVILADNDVVLCRVSGNYYVHLIKAIKDVPEKRYLIGNNKKWINGWIGINNIFGKVTTVEP